MAHPDELQETVEPEQRQRPLEKKGRVRRGRKTVDWSEGEVEVVKKCGRGGGSDGKPWDSKVSIKRR